MAAARSGHHRFDSRQEEEPVRFSRLARMNDPKKQFVAHIENRRLLNQPTTRPSENPESEDDAAQRDTNFRRVLDLVWRQFER